MKASGGRNYHNSLAALLIVGGAACASSGGVPELPATQTVEVTSQSIMGANGRVLLTNNAVPVSTTVNASTQAIWNALPGVLDSLGIPITLVDPPTNTIGNSGFTVHRRLGSTPLSRYIECGTTQIGPNADSYDVYIAFFVQVHRESDSSSAIVTGLDASAKPSAFAGGYSQCSTKRLLETRIVDVVKRRLQIR